MDLVLDFLCNKIKLNNKDKIVIGVSSGPDSMCLLDILLNLREKLNFQIIIAHVNHKKRVESDEEEHFLELYCQDKEVIFEKMEINEHLNGNFEKEARDIRYKFYEKLINKYDANYLMTAHHGDDLIETILMRLVRGSTLKGYSGINLISEYSNYKIIRPFLYITKSDIMEYLKSKNIPYRIDQSNYSTDYTRNRFRINLLPFFKDENENVHLKFLNFNNKLEEANNYIEKVVNNAYNKCYKNMCLDINLFSEFDLFIQKQIFYKIFINLYDDLTIVNDKNLNSLIKLTSEKSNKDINLPGGIIARCEYDKLKFIKKLDDNQSYFFELKNNLILSNDMKFIEYDNSSYGNDTIHLLSDDINLPLYVRNKKKGDYIELKGSGRKKISDIFIDSKIPKNERVNWPIVVDKNDKVIWIPKLKKSKYDRPKGEKCDIIFKCL